MFLKYINHLPNLKVTLCRGEIWICSYLATFAPLQLFTSESTS